MFDSVELLVPDLLEWIGRESHPYSEVIEVWRTSCPRLPILEGANARGFVERLHTVGTEARVRLGPDRAATGAIASEVSSHAPAKSSVS